MTETKKSEAKKVEAPKGKGGQKPKNNAKYNYPTYSGRIPRVSYPIEVHKKLVEIAKKRKTTISKLYTEAITQFVERS